MVVAIQRPQKKEDPIASILKGVQLAAGILNIKEKIDPTQTPQQIQQAKLTDLNIKAAEQKALDIANAAKGQLTPQQALAAADKFERVPVGDPRSTGTYSVAGDSTNKFGLAPRLKQETPEFAFKKEQVKVAEKRRGMDKLQKSIVDFQDKKESIEAQKSFQGAKQVFDLVKDGDAIGSQIALRNLFRISGDVGAIRAEDLRQLGSSPAASEKAVSFWNRWAEGEPVTDEGREQITKALEVIQENQKEKLKIAAKSTAKRDASFISGVDQDELLEQYNIDDWLGLDKFDIKLNRALETKAPPKSPGNNIFDVNELPMVE
jgi:hypothetical protein